MKVRMISRRPVLLFLLVLFLGGCGKKKEPQDYKSKRAAERKSKKMARLAAEHKPVLSKMDHDELKIKTEQLLAAHHDRAALKYLERLIPATEQAAEKERLILLAADLYFAQGEYEKAEEKYHLYERLFPAGAQVEKAAYSKTLCCFYRTLSVDRDQTLTKQTLDYAKEFLTVQSFVDYRSEIQGITQHCYQKLFDHEKDIIEQKLTKGTPASLRAAHMRMGYIKDMLVTECPALNQQYAQLEEAYKPYAQKAANLEELNNISINEGKPALQIAQNAPATTDKKRSYAELF